MPTREQDFAQWYQQVIKAADLAEHSPTRGCMIIKPWGYALWEAMQAYLDAEIKKRHVQNMYCPLLIPLSFLQKEANHVEGFATECAVVTHHRLAMKSGQLVPDAPLAEPMIVRPTSETLFSDIFSRWIQSYRDLPLKLNQWANVMRWEMRPRLFLRTAEFLWQEGHTAHATQQEAENMAVDMAEMYRVFIEDMLAIPVIVGEKTAVERFAGADTTLTLEAMMQDGKAIQTCTSHFLGQNFSKSCDIDFQDKDGQKQHVWMTSWGITTRMIGGLIMSHADDDGLRLPPRIAPCQCVVIPICPKPELMEGLDPFLTQCETVLRDCNAFEKPLNWQVDRSEMRAVDKKWHWMKKGVPIRLEIGQREADQGMVSLTNRCTGEKQSVPLSDLPVVIDFELKKAQDVLYSQAAAYRDNLITVIREPEQFKQARHHNPRGFYVVPWAGSDDDERGLSDTSHTIRVVIKAGSPMYGQLNLSREKCIVSGAFTDHWAVVAQSY